MLPDNNGGKCNLVWKFYSDHLKEMLQNMFDDEFTDVTLVSDDQREIEAHKFVLSSCSAVFKKMLSRNKIPIRKSNRNIFSNIKKYSNLHMTDTWDFSSNLLKKLL